MERTGRGSDTAGGSGEAVVCKQCGESKSLEHYYLNKKNGYRRKVCNECRWNKITEYRKRPEVRERRIKESKEWRAKNCTKEFWQKKYKDMPEYRRQLVKESAQKSKERNRQYIKSCKNKPCADCGGLFEPECMDFHHIDPKTKKFNVANLGNTARALKHIEEEISKCVLLCANCHRKREAIKE